MKFLQSLGLVGVKLLSFLKESMLSHYELERLHSQTRLVYLAVVLTLQETVKEVEKKDTNTLQVPNPDDEDTDEDDVYENVQFSVPKAQPPRK